jgi:hypothetical protein
LEPTGEELMRDYCKLRIEECVNGWVVIVSKKKDEFVSRHVFETKQRLMEWLDTNIGH